MIIKRQKAYSKKDAAKIILGSAAVGGLLGHDIGKKIGEKRGRKAYLDSFDPAEEEKALKSYIKSEQKRLKKAKQGELEDDDFDYYNFINSPEEIEENITKIRQDIDRLKANPKEYAKNKSEKPWNYDVRRVTRHNKHLGAKIGLGSGAIIGTGIVLGKKLIKK